MFLNWVWRAEIFAFCLLIVCPVAAAARITVDAHICDAAAQHAAATSDVPLGVLLSITRVETGRNINGQVRPWPWSANVAGEGHFFNSQEDAILFAESQLAGGSANFDVGCFQINLRWHAKHFASLREAFDPMANAAYAAQFLTELRRSEGSWSAAVSAYHSRTPGHADKYLEKVKTTWRSISGNVEAPILITKAQPRENNFPLLRIGTHAAYGSLVPNTGGISPLISLR